jgi:hypothetical protein
MSMMQRMLSYPRGRLELSSTFFSRTGILPEDFVPKAGRRSASSLLNFVVKCAKGARVDYELVESGLGSDAMTELPDKDGGDGGSGALSCRSC